MSYTIYYQKCNIKLSDNTVIPYHLSGSNNCTDLKGRRCRTWESSRFFCNSKDTPEELLKFSATEEEIRKNVRQYIEDRYLQRVRSTHEFDKDFKNEYKTFEDFLEASAQYWFSMRIPGDKIKSMISYFSAPTITIQELLNTCSSIELGKYIDGYMIREHAKSEYDLLEHMKKGFRIIDTENNMNYTLQLIKRKKPETDPRKKKEQDFAFQVLYGKSPIISYRGTGFKYASVATGKVFKTEGQARKIMEQLQKNTRAIYDFSIEKVSGQFIF